jgi:hypothetical protein
LAGVLAEVAGERARQDERWWVVFGHIEVPLDEESCWDWTGNCDRDGYGIKTFEGRQWRVPRLSYELATGSELGVLHARHTCDRPVCFRPSHLVPGTNLDNVADKVERGRARNQYTNADQCFYGHRFTEDNVYVNPTSGNRQCRTCRRELNRLEKRLAGQPAGLRKVLREVFREQMRQNSIFGEQDHPDLHPTMATYARLTPELVSAVYRLPQVDTVRTVVDQEHERGESNWLRILLEELTEAVEAAALRDTDGLRRELIQFIAVGVQWVQAIDRRGEGQ